MNLDNLFDTADFATAINDGYVRVQTHPTLPYSIANYSEKAQYENVWTDVTRTCRGLIYDRHLRVIARPYRKFFNYGDDANTGPLDLTAPAVVTDKLDGSLGISYPTPDGPAVATRGSFTSTQAVHATALLRRKYRAWRPMGGRTYLWEIVFRDNRIVVDYGDVDDLILHGAVDMATGRVVPAYAITDWQGPKTQTFPYASLGAALAAEPRPNAEGLVVMLNDATMVKIKQSDYVALHRIITGLNARTVWEWLGDGKTTADLCVTVPDEFHAWIEDVSAELTAEAERIVATAAKAHRALLKLLPDGFTRGEYAHAAAGLHCKPYLFLLLDGNLAKARKVAWRAVKPSGARSMVNHSEAVA